MKRFFLTGAMLLCLSLSAWAAEPTYQLTCLPESDSLTLADTIRTRLELHGWREAAGKPDYQLCFQQEARQEVVTDPGYYGPGPYWTPPSTRVVSIPMLTLSASGSGRPSWRGSQDLGDDGLDAAIRQLIDRLPL
ncbi:MAG: DUF4136 domain-containing protein [Paludibacterium sp.]|uniref:hypothetical protein n=1 Tax=Paludibacterium sp. TaxID=1917523 RepID=UPI0025D45556|nr:hypothetical protein [Paludibacterium sp.]MBV8047089.1 DUF4136 domain-containing protein [Paludibacterium sp.]MBV8648594.1 DUF4136 domain-containing protein [Paludibacterium sp.]